MTVSIVSDFIVFGDGGVEGGRFYYLCIWDKVDVKKIRDLKIEKLEFIKIPLILISRFYRLYVSERRKFVPL